MSTSFYLGNKLVNGFLDQNSISPFIITSPITIDWIVVGGGGGGGNYYRDGSANIVYLGGGGGGGGIVTGSITLPFEESIAITIGAVGTTAPINSSTINSTNGESSSISILGTTYYGLGGGRGGSQAGEFAGGNGGSGGGGMSRLEENIASWSTYSGGSSIQFSTYGYGIVGQSGCNGIVGGGGAGGSSEPTANPNCASGGTSLGYQWLDGLRYGKGGIAQSPGQIGTCVIRYVGNYVRGTGGTITQSSGYTYHTFTNNGTFAYN